MSSYPESDIHTNKKVNVTLELSHYFIKKN